MKQKDIHKDCIDHIKVEGYHKKICILTGQDKESVLQFAKEIYENAKSSSTG
jgi:ribosomal protein L6P/L9E